MVVNHRYSWKPPLFLPRRVACRILVPRMHAFSVAKLCLTLWDPMDCSQPRSSVHGIFPARILEWVAISFSKGSSQPRDQTLVSHIAGEFFTIWATREALNDRALSSWSTEWLPLTWNPHSDLLNEREINALFSETLNLETSPFKNISIYLALFS